jgi:hypothetical protein
MSLNTNLPYQNFNRPAIASTGSDAKNAPLAGGIKVT